MPDMRWLTTPSLVLNVLFVLLLAAAVTRRLHDRDRTGLWGLLPVPFMIVGLLNRDAAFALATHQRALSAGEQAMFMATPLFWLAVIFLIVLLVGEGTNGP